MKLLATSLALSTLAIASPILDKRKSNFNWNTTKSLLAFGDSYTYVQGTLGRANYTFIGDAFNLAFTPSQLFSNRIVQNHTSTAEGGPNWVEFLTKCALSPGIHDPRDCPIRLWDFAYAGANTISRTNFTPPHWNHTVSFEQQIQQFAEYGDPALETIHLKKKHALIAIWIGVNDINDLSKLRGKEATFAPLYERVAAAKFEGIEKLYGLGYRSFLLMNLPPLDRSPSPAVNTSLVQAFNEIQSAHADMFQTRYPDVTLLQFDVNTVLNHILDNHEEFGFKNVTGVCPGSKQLDVWMDPGKYGCGEGLDTYFWYDSGHLGSRTHEIFTMELRQWLAKKSLK